jgi:hypothetical protein
MSKNLNALREDTRTEEDIEVGTYRDSSKTSYNPNCSMPEIGRVEIARAMDEYFQGKGIDPELFTYFFSNDMKEDQAEPVINDKGFSINFGNKFNELLAQPDGRETIAKASRESMALANDNPLEGFKTYVADNTNHTAKTWEDVVVGLNKRFEMLGSQTRINSDLCKTR